ncbi:MAG TPA: tRNA (N6-threonylcarbamoyladenosine(37)-N6)-methyltransferase TrmO [Actinomycetota bacterium]|nr:tRNA (N6-threonylcarbamoyladenosine(37)-N6)-methyltransferase TrmO [Actinomycetota bacterium]
MEPPFVLDPIGAVVHSHPDDVLKDQWHSLTSEIHVREDLADGLQAIDGFSHLFILFWMHRLPQEARARLQIQPRGLLRLGLTPEELPTIGVFACDAPPRPNPIGLSIVELIGRRGTVLTVRGLDAFAGAPVIDIKPYTKDRLVADLQESGWHAELIAKTGARRV